MLLLTSVGTTLAFQTSSNNHQGGNGRSSGYSPSSWTRLAANTDGGMDALTAQLQAAYAQAAASTNTEIESSNALVEDYANEMMNESRSAAIAATTEPKIGKHAIASLLMQRASKPSSTTCPIYGTSPRTCGCVSSSTKTISTTRVTSMSSMVFGLTGDGNITSSS